MRKVAAGLGSLVVAAGLTTTFALSAGAAPPDVTRAQTPRPVVDDVPNAAEEKRRELREAAIRKVIAGDAKVQQRGASEVVKVGRTKATKTAPAEDQYVELAREKTDKIFVVLAEFGNERHPSYPDQDTDPNTAGPSRFDGPLHNQIPEPDRSVDNKTIWQPDFNREHFQELYFGDGPNDNSVKNYYERQSSGRYSVDGQVTDWVKVRYNEARYGRSNGFPCPGSVCSNSQNLITDALNAWVADQKAAGRTDAQIAEDLKSYDVWDRNDYDADGNFNEPDGYIDHFQIVHAGGDQADADPYQGEDAIWSHRSKAFTNLDGTTGPDFNKDGGVQIGTTGLWVADYTMQPENGGVSVFVHEYAHDLGLPDEYDTAAATGTQENAANWWTLMAQSRQSGVGEPVGFRASDLGAWDKLQLGWLDYEVVPAGTARTLDLGPSEYNSAKAQGVVMPLPKKTVTTPLGAPHGGTKQWWSDQGDERESTLTRQVTLPAGSASLSFWARWNIEDCGPDACDYAFVEVDDGTGFKAIPGSIAKAAEGNGIDGYQGAWTQGTFDLSAYAGKTISLRLRYSTDAAVQGAKDHETEPAGIFADDFTLTAGGQTVFGDDAESGNNGWTPDGFVNVGASRSIDYDNYYVASNRQYVSYDQYLKTGPYNYLAPAKPNFAEHFPYQDGLIVSYWDTSYSDNNESVHPGEGEILPIDANPRPIYRLDGQPWRPRIQTYDAPFSLEKSDSFSLHMPNGQLSYIRGQDAVPVFDDRRSYWDPVQPNVGVKVPAAGVRIAVQKQDGTSMRIKISSTKQPAN
jgi:immune inhibitor A